MIKLSLSKISNGRKFYFPADETTKEFMRLFMRPDIKSFSPAQIRFLQTQGVSVEIIKPVAKVYQIGDTRIINGVEQVLKEGNYWA